MGAGKLNMYEGLIGCKNTEDNTCERKDTCLRININDVDNTLWKNMCTTKNNRVLYIEKQIEDTKDKETNDEEKE